MSPAPTGVADADGGLELPASARGRAPAPTARAGSSAFPTGSRPRARAPSGDAACRRRSSRAGRGRARPGAARACRSPARRRSAPTCPRRPGSRRRGPSSRITSPGEAAHARPRRRCRGASRCRPSRDDHRSGDAVDLARPRVAGPAHVASAFPVEGDLVADRLPEDPQVLRAPLGFDVCALAARQGDDERRGERVDPAPERCGKLVEEGLVHGDDVSLARADRGARAAALPPRRPSRAVASRRRPAGSPARARVSSERSGVPSPAPRHDELRAKRRRRQTAGRAFAEQPQVPHLVLLSRP